MAKIRPERVHKTFEARLTLVGTGTHSDLFGK